MDIDKPENLAETPDNKAALKEDMSTTTALAIVLLFAVLYLLFSNYQLQQKVDEMTPIIVLDVAAMQPKEGYTKDDYMRDYLEAAEQYKSLGYVVLDAKTVVSAPESILVEVK